jgi:2-polyprenyl-6-hydroxyphenyl methylase/3-demethylubiquinone-9 3-methyltransferase
MLQSPSSTTTHSAEVARGERFEFGANWANFLQKLDDPRIAQAEASLVAMLELPDLRGMSFLDIGSGSGLFSLAARRLGAHVVSFDFDPRSVACTAELRRRYFPDDPQWAVHEGSVLDEAFMRSLGAFDVVYSWGVLHHTGEMWRALAHADLPVKAGGRLFIALYNHQPVFSRYWTLVKRLYNRHRWMRPLFIGLHGLYPVLPSILVRRLTGRALPRGMSVWYDLQDWLGGYPFEVSRPEEVLRFYRPRGYQLTNMTTAGGRHGCNEFVFLKAATRACP